MQLPDLMQVRGMIPTRPLTPIFLFVRRGRRRHRLRRRGGWRQDRLSKPRHEIETYRFKVPSWFLHRKSVISAGDRMD